MLKKFGLTGALAAVLLLMAPAAGFAREQGGGHGGRGFSGGHAFSGGRGFAYRGGGGRGYIGGRGLEGRGYRGYYSGGGPSFYFGYGAPYYYNPYTYSPGTCGNYDAYGYWHPSPGCYADPYYYGY